MSAWMMSFKEESNDDIVSGGILFFLLPVFGLLPRASSSKASILAKVTSGCAGLAPNAAPYWPWNTSITADVAVICLGPRLEAGVCVWGVFRPPRRLGANMDAL